MNRFDLYQQHPVDFFAKHIVRVKKDGKWTAETKRAGHGFGHWMYKIWRGISSDEAHASKIQKCMVEAIGAEINKTHVKVESHLIVLSNMYFNLKGFNQAVVVPHNKSLITRILFWTKIPEAPKEMINKLVQRVDQLMVATKADLLKINIEKLTLSDAVEQIKDLKQLLAAIDTLGKAADFNTVKTSELKSTVLQGLNIVAQKITAESQLLQKHVQDNTWKVEDDQVLKQLSFLHQDMESKWVVDTFNGMPGAEKLLVNLENLNKDLGVIQGKVDQGGKLIDDACEVFKTKIANMSRQDLATKANPVITEDLFNYLMSRSYVPKSKKDILTNWITFWKGDTMNLLGKAEAFFQQAEKLKEDLYTLNSEDLASRDEIFGRNVGNHHQYFAYKSNTLKVIMNRLVTLETSMKTIKKDCLSKKLLEELGNSLADVKEQHELLLSVATKKKIAEEVVDSLFDEVKIMECMKLIYAKDFDGQKPLAPQIQKLVMEPLTLFFEQLVVKGKGATAFATNLRAPCIKYDMINDDFKIEQDNLKQFGEKLKQASLNPSLGYSPANLSLLFVELSKEVKGLNNKFKLESLTTIPPELRIEYKLNYNLLEESMKILQDFQVSYKKSEQSIESCLKLPHSTMQRTQRLWAFVDTWNKWLFGDTPPPKDENYIQKTRDLLKKVETPNHPLINTMAHKEIKQKLKELEAVQVLIDIRSRFVGWLEGTSNEPFTYSDMVVAVALAQKGQALYEGMHLSAPKELKQLLGMKTKELQKLYIPYGAKFVGIHKNFENVNNMIFACINHKIEVEALKKKGTEPSPEFDKEVFDNLINDASLGADKASELKDLRALLDVRLGIYLKKNFLGEEFPSSGPVEKKDIALLNSLKLSKDSKSVVEMLAKMQELGMHPTQVCPCSQDTLDNPVRTKSQPYFYFDREGILGWLKVKQTNPTTNAVMKPEDLEPCPEVVKLIAAYKELFKG